ncbi:MAG: hypothetical protein IPF79_04745 [Ignavibacteria bacterium]|nr:hypothetical protein [Ignavibacteria bacterium]
MSRHYPFKVIPDSPRIVYARFATKWVQCYWSLRDQCWSVRTGRKTFFDTKQHPIEWVETEARTITFGFTNDDPRFNLN